MKHFFLYIFCLFFSSWVYGQHSQIESARSLYEKDSITQFKAITIKFDTAWFPGDANKIINEADWLRGDSIYFVKFHPVVSENDTSLLSLQEVINLQFDYLKHYSSERVSTFETYNSIGRVSFTFNSSGYLVSESIRFASKESDQALYYSDQLVEYEYSGPFIHRKKYFDKLSDTKLKLTKVVTFQYIR